MSPLTKLAIASFALTISLSASHAKQVKISGTHTPGEIAKTCEKSGGTFHQGSKAIGGAFGCTNIDKGTSVNCQSNGKCTGEVPG